MRQTSWNEEEDEAMQGLPLEAQLLYLRGLRQHMDYDTGMVGGSQRRISWRSLREVLYVEPHKGINGGMPDRAKARRVIQWLEKAGLAERLEDSEHLLFRLPKASLGSSVQKKADPFPTHFRPPEPDQETDPEADPSEVAAHGESAGKDDPQPDPEADPKPTPEGAQKADPHPVSGTPVQQPPCSPPEGDGTKKRSGKRSSDKPHPLFETWYQNYPNKKAKQAAVKAFNKIDPDQDLVERMIQAIHDQQREEAWKHRAGEFVPEWPHPATWLNQRRWEDEVQTEPPAEVHPLHQDGGSRAARRSPLGAKFQGGGSV
jgi:hypothetical protein